MGPEILTLPLGQCVQCGYTLRGLTGPACPECGRAINGD